jgi:hypothetical protein
MKPFAQAIGMHGALAGVVEKLYAYRGDEQAVAHGATRVPGDLTAGSRIRAPYFGCDDHIFHQSCPKQLFVNFVLDRLRTVGASFRVSE